MKTDHAGRACPFVDGASFRTSAQVPVLRCASGVAWPVPGKRAAGAAVALAAMLAAGPCVAGAWVQDQGATLMILKASHSDSGVAFDDGHHRTQFPDDGSSRQDQINLYVEHGLTDDLTFIGNFYLSRYGYRNRYGDSSTSGLGDQEIGLRYRLDPGAQASWQRALQVLLSIPAYDKDDDPALGFGDYNVELRYSVGRGYSLGTHDAYLDMGMGVRLRGADSADEVRLDIASGVSLAPRWMLIGELNVIQGLGNGSGDNPLYLGQENGNPIASNNYDLTKLQLSALYTLPSGSQLQAGYQQPIAGRNTGGGGAAFVAVWWRF